MTECNLLYDSRTNPYRAISFLKKNNFNIVSDKETDTVFVLESVYAYPQLIVWEIGKAYAENRKIVVLSDDDENDIYLEDWLFESACATFNIRTGEEMEMIEI